VGASKLFVLDFPIHPGSIRSPYKSGDFQMHITLSKTKYGTRSIDVLNVMVVVFSAIILFRYQTLPKVLKDALAHLGPYQTLRRVWYDDPGAETIQI
jgi:hypothetical protein